MSNDAVVIAAARRTPLGGFQGALSPLSGHQLAAAVFAAVLEDAHVAAEEVSEVLLGCVLPAGQGQAPARQAALGAGLPTSVPCTTINKVCGSGMKSLMLGHDLIRAGSADIVLVGGTESMTNAPYLLPKARGGYRMGHQQVLDHMFFDGLQNPYDGNMMGYFAEQTVAKYGMTREQQDEFAATSVRRALAAIESGAFDAEIVPLQVKSRRGEQRVDKDEEPFNCDLDKIPTLRPAFAKDGSVTAASSSGIADGAAALVLMSEATAATRNIQPLARIAGHGGHAQAPEWFTTANIGAIDKLRQHIGWSEADVDLYEINEAFACVTMATMQDLDLPLEKVNVNGGACALGHPIGASGARIVVTLLHALRQRELSRGIASLCIGGGESTAVAVELS